MIKWYSFGFAWALLLSGCGETRSEFNGAILPVVDAATPLALKATTLAAQNIQPVDFSLMSEGSDAAVKAGIAYLFATLYPNINGANVTGYFRSSIDVVDTRASTEGVDMVAANADACLNGAAYTPAISALPTLTNLTIYPACTRIFATGGGNQAGEGSGYSYGEKTETDGKLTVTSWLTLVQTNAVDKFAMMGNIKNAAAATDAEKEAEVMFLESGPDAGSWKRHTIARINAKPATNAFEFAIASTSQSVMNAPSTASSDITGFGCGIQMVSDGTNIRAKGTQKTGAGTCATSAGTAFDICLTAADLTVQADSVCASMTFSMAAITHAIFDSTAQTAIASSLMVGAATTAKTVE